MMFRALTVPLAAASIIAFMPTAFAGPLEACAAATANESEVSACLQTKIETSYAAMNEALAAARAAAQAWDEVAGGDAAVFALEASQQAWEGYRDTKCTLLGLVAGAGDGSSHAHLACEIEMVRDRAVELHALAEAMSD